MQGSDDASLFHTFSKYSQLPQTIIIYKFHILPKAIKIITPLLCSPQTQVGSILNNCNIHTEQIHRIKEILE